MTGLLVQTTTPSEPVAGVAARRRAGRGLWGSIKRSPKAIVGLVIFLFFCLVAIWPSLFTSVKDPMAYATSTKDLGLHPSATHLLGTTSFGQDIFAQIIYGTRESLLIALIAGAFATVLSVLVGVSAAYLGGLADEALSLLTNVFLVLPTFPLIIILATYAGRGSLVVVVAVLVATGWSYGANQLRAQTLSLRNRDFLESARVRGERRSYIIVFELLPTMTSLIVANFLGAALYSVLAAAGLQFLGLGDTSAVSWGTMLHWSQSAEALQIGIPLWSVAPGLCVALLGTSFALLNYAFDEISNPALRPVRKLKVRSYRGKRAAS
jgi:peptide/nickel transport system permease protein